MAAPRRLPRAARRAQLVEAAATAFLERGFAGTSMDDVAQVAGVSRLMVYRIFESKSDLYRAVLSSVIDELAAQVAGRDVTDVVAAQGASQLILPVARAHPDAFRLLWRHALHEPEFADQAKALRSAVTEYGRRLLRPYITDAVGLEWAARTASTQVVEGICHWLDVGDPSRDDEFAAVMTAGQRALATAWVRSLADHGPV